MDQFANSKLIEILNKLTSGNKLVQFQAISKLHSMIVGEIGKNETEKKKFLNKIIEVYGSISSKNACIALLDMLIRCSTDGFINYEQLINSLLIIINSKCQNSIHCLEAITHLMVEFEDDFIARYSIRNPSHPFIEILSNNSSDFVTQLVFKQIRYIFDNKNSLTLLKPVIIHLFLEESSILKHQVANYLIQNLTTNDQMGLKIELINRYFSCIKRRELKSSVFLLDSVDSLLKFYETCNEESLLVRNIPLSRLIAFLIDIDQSQCCDCSSHFNSIKNLFIDKNTSFKKEVISTELIELLAENLGKIGLNNLMSYLDLIYEVVTNYSGDSKLDLALFIPNLLAWILCLGSVEQIGSTFNHLTKKCNMVVSKIQDRLNESTLLYDCGSKLSSNIYNLIEYEEEQEDENAENVNYRLLNTLCANFILNEFELDSIQKICFVFKKLVLKFPNLYPMLFCLYIMKLRSSCNAEIISYIVNSMVDLIGPKVDLSLCLNVLKSLMIAENATIKLACIRLMTKLCTMKFDYIVYPLLSKELVTIPQKTDTYRLEELYTKAYSIHQIVSYRPDYYAQELLATISNLLNTCSSMRVEQGVCALLIDSLAILCESQVLDMKSTWNALKVQYKNEIRPLTLTAYCRFMSVVCKIDHLNDSENEFYLKMVQTLWLLIDNDSKDQVTISSALNELSKFKKDAFRCSFLPIKIQDNLKQRNKKAFEADENKGKSLDEIFPQIQAACYIDLFNSISSQTYPGLKELFKSILSEEIDAMPRRMKSLAREKVYSQDEQRAAQKAFYDHLRGYFLGEPDLDIIVILFSYDAPGDRNLEGKLVKRHIKPYWENYEKTYRLILSNNGNIELDEANVDLYKNGLLRFIKSAYFACIQAIELEDEKPKNSSCLARDKLTEILVQSYLMQSDARNGDVYILVLLAIIQITTEQIVLPTQDDNEFNQRKWLEVIIDFILNIRESKTGTSESEYISQFNYIQSHSAETLRFLYRIYDVKRSTLDWNFLDYFMCETLESCAALKVSSFLIQYIERIVNGLIDGMSSIKNTKYVFKTISVYIRTLISRGGGKFDMEKNIEINRLLKSLFDRFKTSSNIDETRYLRLFVECLFSLYNDDSIYYDDINLLSNMIELLDGKNSSNDNTIESLVYLSCLAYKSNLIGNDIIHSIYERLNKKSKFNKLLAFYLRYLLNYGFIDALVWIQNANHKWHTFYNDFKLNLVTDLTELEQCLEGLLVLHSGVSIETLNIDQPSMLPIELENILKPETTIKDILKFLKTSSKQLHSSLDRSLSYLLFKRNDIKYEEIYSAQNTFDYLDNQSLLKALTNEALRISKASNGEEEKGFKFLIETFGAGWRTSTSKSLPPINWLNLVNTLLKSRFGSQVECELIELALGQIEHSNSAFALIKNYLIDTNYFTRLQTGSQKIVLENLPLLFDRLNDMLLKKLLGRLRVFLHQKWSHHQTTIFFSLILDSIYRFFDRKKDNNDDENDDQIKTKEIIEFFVFITKEFTFSVDNPNECLILEKIVKIIIQLKDDRLKLKIIDVADLIPVDPRFIMNFYFRAHLVSRYNQPISLINQPIENFITHIEMVNDETKSIMINSFAQCLLELIYYDYKANPDSNSTNAKNVLLNWIIGFMNSVKSISISDKHNSNSVRFAIQIYKIFLHCMTMIQSIDLYDPNNKRAHVVECWSKLANLDSIHRKFSTQSFWKQINAKSFDWLISLMSAKNFPQDLTETFTSTVIGIFTREKLSDQMWFKFANLINKSISS